MQTLEDESKMKKKKCQHKFRIEWQPVKEIGVHPENAELTQ